MNKLLNIVCIFLAFVLVFGLIPLSSAATTDIPPSVSEADFSNDPGTECTENPETADSTTETDNPDTGISTFATYKEGKYRQKALVWTHNGESVSYEYNGVNHKYSYLIMHSLYHDGEFRSAYCIEPGKKIYNNSIYEEEQLGGADPWEQLDYSKQRGVSLALLYGYPNSIDSDDMRTQIAYQLATYMIVHEIILGWRDSVHPFTRTNDGYFDAFGGGTPGKTEKLEITSEYYSSIHQKFLRSEDIWYAYNYISDHLASHDLIPSFCSRFESQMPTYTMESNDDGTYSITLHDTNNILSAYTFADNENITYSTSDDGQSLTITVTGSQEDSIVISPSKTVPSVENSAFFVWNSSTGGQALCTLEVPTYDPVPAYFRLKLPTGNIEIQKGTSDGQCLSDWQFYIYSDETCLDLVSGPHISNDSGFVVVTGLNVGTYWIQEGENISADVNDLYDYITVPQQVTIVAGETVTVNFMNQLKPNGTLEIIKTTDTEHDLGHWEFALFSDKACKTLLYGPVSTDVNGKIVLDSIKPGTYWVRELGNNYQELDDIYSCADSNPKQVTIVSGEIATVSFHNVLRTVQISIIKIDPYGNALSDAQFKLEYSQTGKNWYPVTYSEIPAPGTSATPGIENGLLSTGKQGELTYLSLYPNLYYRLTEVKAPDGYQLLDDHAFLGYVSADDIEVILEVTNTPVFTLPHTGLKTMHYLLTGFTICLLTCVSTIIYLRRKEY